jgi:SAM-dependent methyltransferase
MSPLPTEAPLPADPLGDIAGRKLNLGCAQFPLAGYVNVDLSPRTRADLLCNLDGIAYPFASGHFDAILASHILEHLGDPFAAMNECYRLLRPGGVLLIKVPHFTRGFTHPEHKCGFDVSFPLFFDPKMTPWYTGTPFVLERMRLRWNAQPYLKRWVASPLSRNVARVLGVAIDAVANRMPMVFSRLFAYAVGGFEEIEFRFRTPGREAD